MRGAARHVVVVALVATHAVAATHVAATCSRADVGAAFQLAADGDEVLIPPGTCAWQSLLAVNKRITLRGSGEGVTVLQDDVPKDGSQVSMLLDVAADGVRLTGFTLEGLRADPGFSVGHITAYSRTNWRIDHVTFRRLVTNAVTAGGQGLIDHCSLVANYTGGVQVRHPHWDGGTENNGDESWAAPSSMGTLAAVFVEDCAFTNTAAQPPALVEVELGGRAVVRHNVFIDGTVFQAGTDSAQRQRAGRHVEVSQNEFRASFNISAAVSIEGGTGVVFGNTTEPLIAASLRVVVNRASASYAPWGKCDGSGPYDETPLGACVDQPGRGQGVLLTGEPPLPAGWPNEVLDPVYVWNELSDGGASVNNSTSARLAAGRDYVVGPRPMYVPVPYPHPLNVADLDGGVLDGGALDGGLDDAGSQGPEADGGASGRRTAQVGCGCSGAPTLAAVVALAWLSRRRRRAAQ